MRATIPARIEAVRFSPENRRRLSGPGLRAFVNIAERWHLTEEERLLTLGLPERATYDEWVARATSKHELTLPLDTLLRISGILGIHKCLRMLFDSGPEQVAWLREPHHAPLFGGQPPMALVTNGTQDGIMLVRRYLDALQHGFVPH